VQGQYHASLSATESSISALEKVLSATLEGQAADQAVAGSLRREVLSLKAKISKVEEEREVEKVEFEAREKTCREEVIGLKMRIEKEWGERVEEIERERNGLQVELGVARGEGDASIHKF
jgi:hypothetical protein